LRALRALRALFGIPSRTIRDCHNKLLHSRARGSSGTMPALPALPAWTLVHKNASKNNPMTALCQKNSLHPGVVMRPPPAHLGTKTTHQPHDRGPPDHPHSDTPRDRPPPSPGDDHTHPVTGPGDDHTHPVTGPSIAAASWIDLPDDAGHGLIRGPTHHPTVKILAPVRMPSGR
jgi:hypothetical protein